MLRDVFQRFILKCRMVLPMGIMYIIIMFLAHVGFVMNQAPEVHNSWNVRSTILCTTMLLGGLGLWGSGDRGNG